MQQSTGFKCFSHRRLKQKCSCIRRCARKTYLRMNDEATLRSPRTNKRLYVRDDQEQRRRFAFITHSPENKQTTGVCVCVCDFHPNKRTPFLWRKDHQLLETLDRMSMSLSRTRNFANYLRDNVRTPKISELVSPARITMLLFSMYVRTS